MSSHGPPDLDYWTGPSGDAPAYGFATCPSCGLYAKLDADQLTGRVSIDCPECSYHETHELVDPDKIPEVQ